MNKIICRGCWVTWYKLRIPLKEGDKIKAKHLITIHKFLPKPKNGYSVTCPNCQGCYAKAIINGVEHKVV